MKNCSKCNKQKPLNEFNKNKNSKDGHEAACKLCRSLSRKTGRGTKEKTGKKFSRKEWVKKFKKRDPIKHKAYQYRNNWLQRSKKQQLEHTVPTRLEIETWLRNQEPFRCYYTGVPVEEISLDHKNPIALGGDYSLSNVVVTSSKINGAKGHLTDEQFKQLLTVIEQWPDKGESLLKRLRYAGGMYS